MTPPYETQLRDCIRDTKIMLQAEIDYCATGRHTGQPMRNVLDQWRSLVRDMENLLNREDSAYGRKD